MQCYTCQYSMHSILVKHPASETQHECPVLNGRRGKRPVFNGRRGKRPVLNGRRGKRPVFNGRRGKRPRV